MPDASSVAAAQLLDVRQVAAILNCSTRTVYRLADASKIPRPVRIGGLVRWPQNAISDWIAGGCQSGRPKTQRRPR